MDMVRFRRFQTRITIVWALTIILTLLLAGLWFILQPTLVFLIITVNGSIEGADLNSTNTENVISLLTLAVNIFIPIMILGLWLWAGISSQRKSWAGYEVE